MKKNFAALAVCIVASLFALVAGCAGMQVSTPAQIAAALCVPTNTAVSTINSLAKQNPTDASIQTASAALTKIQPTIDAVCSQASTINSTTVQTLIEQGLPALGTILGTLPLPGATLANIETDFSLAEMAVDLVDVVVTNIKSAQANPASASASVSLMAAKPFK